MKYCWQECESISSLSGLPTWSHAKLRNATITFSTWSRACVQEIQQKAQQPSFDTCLQTRNASSRNPYMSNSVRFKVQFGAKCAKTCTWFHEITSFDRFDSTSSPLWDCDLGSSRMASDHYEGINLSAALQAQHLKVSRARVIPKRCIFVGGFNSRSSYRPNKLLILNM